MRTRDQSAVARIFREQSVCGGGVLVSPRHVLTCTHVAALALKPFSSDALYSVTLEPGAGPITLDFPEERSRQKYTATVVKATPIQDVRKRLADRLPDADLTLLLLDREIQHIELARFAGAVDPSELEGDLFEVFGFPSSHAEGANASGSIGGHNAALIQLIRKGDMMTQQGFSGCPVWNQSREAFAGIVAMADLTPDRKSAFMIPALTLAGFFPSLQYTRARMKGDPELIHQVVHLCDRAAQNDALGGKLPNFFKKPRHTPFVTVLHGNDEEALESYVSRLRDERLPKWLNGRVYPQSHQLDWPADFYQRTSSPERVREFMDARSSELGLEDPRDSSPLFITMLLLTEEFGFGVSPTDILLRVLEYWCRKTLVIERQVIVCIALRYTNPSRRSFLRRVFLERRNTALRRLLKNLAHETAPEHRLITTETLPVPRREVDRWSEEPPVRELRRIDPVEIKEIYERENAPWERGGPIAMDSLTPELKRLLSGETA
jgi:hypothetical protein